MNLILEKTNQVLYFTNMREVLVAASISAADYDWYISDVETNYGPAKEFSLGDCWVSGEELADILQRKDLQFNWAVFSAVPKGFRSVVMNPPYADGNSEYWNGQDIAPQLVSALFEIVCWDSSATILIGLPAQAGESFKRHFHDSSPLSAAAGK
jgi:hypothetical protein